MQLGVAISTLCNFMMDRCGNFNFMQLNETICNCVESETCCNYIATYVTICNYIATYATICNLCNYNATILRRFKQDLKTLCKNTNRFKCNYIATIFSNIGEWSNATILQPVQLYATILQLMQLYATYATTMQQSQEDLNRT